jgi:hypothetical protein
MIARYYRKLGLHFDTAGSHLSLKVDLFITVMANLQWVVISYALFPGQTSYDRPNLAGCPSAPAEEKIHSRRDI